MLFLLNLLALTATHDAPASIRVATFNCSLNRASEGELIVDLTNSDDAQARNVAEILQRVRPDLVLLNEFDYDAEGKAARLFRENYLSRPQNGAEPIDYPYVFVPAVNTGVASGLDLDNDGQVSMEPGNRGYGNDAFGFGQFPGQYGMVLLSRFPIQRNAVRSFQDFLWKDMPNARLPRYADGRPWYSDDELGVLRLSSKTHCDVPIEIGGSTLHVLISHPTPPTFDGPEKRNVARNRDEIRLWVDYITGGDASRYLFPGTVPTTPASFLVLGDLNADPTDGSGDQAMIRRLLDHPRVRSQPTPRSDGAKTAAATQGGANADHIGPPEEDTADFDDRSVGNLRVDYVLPSKDWEIVASGVFWPTPGDPLARLVSMNPAASSDHRLVWSDLRKRANHDGPDD